MSYKLAFLTLCSTPQPCSRVSTHLKSGSSTFIQAAASAREKALPLSEDGEGWGRSCHPPWGEVFVLHDVPAQPPGVQGHRPAVSSHAPQRVYFLKHRPEAHGCGGGGGARKPPLARVQASLSQATLACGTICIHAFIYLGLPWWFRW